MNVPVGQYVHRDFWPKLTLEQVKEQIAIRDSLLQQMVGSLYPSIVNDELRDLHLLVVELQKPKQVEMKLEQPKPKMEEWPWP